jgi:hypothetical protein
MTLPEPVAEDDDPVAAVDVLLGEKHASERRRRAHHLEEVRADRAGGDRFGVAGSGQHELTEAIDRHAVEGLRRSLPVVEVRR